MKTFRQESAYTSPWTIRERIGFALWRIAWLLLCRWTPSPLSSWRVFVLRCFGARVSGRPFVHQRARIQIPWHLTLRDRACLGDGANAYSLGPIELHEGCTVAQEVYLCTGTHDFARDHLPLQTAPIVIGAHAFIGVRALILPGVTIGERAVIGAGAVVSRDQPPGMICAGQPCRPLRPRAAKAEHQG